MSCSRLKVIAWVVVAAGFALPSDASDTASFPPVTEAERMLDSVPGAPSAPAVILSKSATVRFARPPREPRSSLDVRVRTKILSEAGLDHGQVALGQGAGLELVAFEGRTVRPDGSVVPLDRDAVFRQTPGGQRAATRVAFPAVEVGAILDYRFRLAWRAPVFPEPWLFDDRVPTRSSELTYEVPPGWRVRHHLRRTGRATWETEASSMPGGGRRTVLRLRDLDAVPDEPAGFPYADLAHAAWLVTERIVTPDNRAIDIAADWATVSAPYVTAYDAARRFGRDARRLARRLTADLADPRARVEAIYRHVRDHVRTTSMTIRVGEGAAVDHVLRDGQGSAAEVALLLATMLEAANQSARLVWAADWRDGWPDTEIVRPGWFSHVLVATRVGRERLWLDATDRRLAAGRLAPLQEGTGAVLIDPPRAEAVVLPTTPPEGSARRADVHLALDEAGALGGTGTLELTGHHAWFYLLRRETPEAVAAGWVTWLEDRFEGFAVTVERVVEDVDGARIEVVFGLRQRPSDVLGDEASLLPSLPLGPLSQRYPQTPAERRTAARASFADHDAVTLELTWPDGWEIDLEPPALQVVGASGEAEATVSLDPAARRLTYRRTVTIRNTVFFPGAAYAALHELYQAVERHDAQPVVLVALP